MEFSPFVVILGCYCKLLWKSRLLKYIVMKESFMECRRFPWHDALDSRLSDCFV